MTTMAVVLTGALISLAASSAVTMETCPSAGTPGMPGIPGIPGRDGRDGVNGDRGDPGVAVQPGLAPQRGPKGGQGLPGGAGKHGQSGPQGPQGPPGEAGPPGEPARLSARQQSAFSVARATTELPLRATPIRFLSVITNVNDDYDLNTGKYRCSIPGTYYFVFHASAVSRLCLLLKVDGLVSTSFCDQLDEGNARQVFSGGLSLHLDAGQEVWLETSVFRGLGGKLGGNSVFSGFLLHAN